MRGWFRTVPALAAVVAVAGSAAAVESTAADEQQRSGSGAPVHRYEEPKEEAPGPEHAGRNLEAVEAHVEKHVGEIESVFHEIASELVHVDVLWVKASAKRPFHVLVTSGVSDLPMTVPEDLDVYDRVELVIALPRDWPLDQESFEDEKHYWPVRWLKTVGRLPHRYDTWLGWGHTIPNGDPPEALAGTRFTGFILYPTYWLGEEFAELASGTGDVIGFYDLTPIYQEEMAFKLEEGAEALAERLDKHNIDYVVDVARTNVMTAKRKWFFQR